MTLARPARMPLPPARPLLAEKASHIYAKKDGGGNGSGRKSLVLAPGCGAFWLVAR